VRSGPGSGGRRRAVLGVSGLMRARLSPGRVIAPKKARIVQQRKLKKVSGAGGGEAGRTPARRASVRPPCAVDTAAAFSMQQVQSAAVLGANLTASCALSCSVRGAGLFMKLKKI
jgi:hypothetical protein